MDPATFVTAASTALSKGAGLLSSTYRFAVSTLCALCILGGMRGSSPISALRRSFDWLGVEASSTLTSLEFWIDARSLAVGWTAIAIATLAAVLVFVFYRSRGWSTLILAYLVAAESGTLALFFIPTVALAATAFAAWIAHTREISGLGVLEGADLSQILVDLVGATLAVALPVLWLFGGDYRRPKPGSSPVDPLFVSSTSPAGGPTGAVSAG